MKPNHQPYPQQGKLVQNLNLTAGTLQSLLDEVGFRAASVYCYVVATIKSDGLQFLQTGNAPNFQGDLITLCTCKHFMRTFMTAPHWKGKWIAGFTGAEAGGGRNALVYLMQVAHGFESHRELWLSEALTSAAKEAKAADRDRFGDVYRPTPEPNDPLDPMSYLVPVEGHVHAAGEWRDDIDYVGCAGRRPALLVGEVGLSFLWSKPMVFYSTGIQRLHRGQKKWGMGSLLQQLQGLEIS